MVVSIIMTGLVVLLVILLVKSLKIMVIITARWGQWFILYVPAQGYWQGDVGNPSGGFKCFIENPQAQYVGVYGQVVTLLK